MSGGRDSSRNTLLALIAIFLAGFVLYVTRPVVVPVLFAVFLAILVQPMVARLSRRLPYWLGLVIVLLGLTLAFVVTGFLLGNTVAGFVGAAPKYSARLEKVLEGALRYLESRGIHLSWEKLGVQENISRALGFIGSWLTSLAALVGQFSVVVVLMIIALIEARGFEGKITAAFGPERGREILSVLQPMGKGVQRYLRTKTLVSLVTGLVAYVVCLFIGIDGAFLWAAFVFLLNYIPYVGPVAAVIPAVAVAFLQYESPTRGIIAACTLGFTQWMSGSVIEPPIMGRSLRLSVLFLLVSMLFWGWFWGLAGVVLSIPLSSAFVIACSHIERLKPIAILLGAEPSDGGSGNREEDEQAKGQQNRSKKEAAGKGDAS